jgi:hypothetical protein
MVPRVSILVTGWRVAVGTVAPHCDGLQPSGCLVRALPPPLDVVKERKIENMRLKRLVLGLTALTSVAFAIAPSAVSARPPHSKQKAGAMHSWHRAKHKSGTSVPRYQHIVEIMMENTSYGSIIGNSLAPNINALANRYGLATN